MELDSRSRKWQITINNPVEKGYTHECINVQQEQRRTWEAFLRRISSVMVFDTYENKEYKTRDYLTRNDWINKPVRLEDWTQSL